MWKIYLDVVPLAVSPPPPNIFWSVTQHWVGGWGGGGLVFRSKRCLGGGERRRAALRLDISFTQMKTRYILYLDKYIYSKKNSAQMKIEGIYYIN